MYSQLSVQHFKRFPPFNLTRWIHLDMLEQSCPFKNSFISRFFGVCVLRCILHSTPFYIHAVTNFNFKNRQFPLQYKTLTALLHASLLTIFHTLLTHQLSTCSRCPFWIESSKRILLLVLSDVLPQLHLRIAAFVHISMNVH